MDVQVQHPDRIENMSGFILALKEQLPGLNLPEENTAEIQKHLDNHLDYAGLQAIIDILSSLADAGGSEKINRFLSQFHF